MNNNCAWKGIDTMGLYKRGHSQVGRNPGCLNPVLTQASTCPADDSESMDTGKARNLRK